MTSYNYSNNSKNANKAFGVHDFKSPYVLD
jgi:hypothetical protein